MHNSSLSLKPTVPPAQMDYMPACILSPGSLPEYKPSCCFFSMPPSAAARCSDEAFLLHGSAAGVSFLRLQRPPLGQQPALLTSIPKHLASCPTACDFGYLSPPLVLFDLRNSLGNSSHKWPGVGTTPQPHLQAGAPMINFTFTRF